MSERNLRVLADGFKFLEGPRWRDGELWMAEIGAGEVVTISPAGKRRTVVNVPGTPSGLGFLPDGTPLVVSMRERRLMRIKGNRLEEHADLSKLSSFLNDMVVDRQGRAYVGDFGYDVLNREPSQPGSIILVQPDGRASVVGRGLKSHNGTMVTADGHLIVGESGANRLVSFPMKPDGTLGEMSILATLEGAPDGSCLDVAGAVWAALFDKNRFVRVMNGKVIETIETPGRHAVACQLGGSDGLTLFCLTYKGALHDIGKAFEAQVEIADVDVAGAGSP